MTTPPPTGPDSLGHDAREPDPTAHDDAAGRDLGRDLGPGPEDEVQGEGEDEAPGAATGAAPSSAGVGGCVFGVVAVVATVVLAFVEPALGGLAGLGLVVAGVVWAARLRPKSGAGASGSPSGSRPAETTGGGTRGSRARGADGLGGVDGTQHTSWYAPRDEGGPDRFVGADGMPSVHLVEYRDSGGGVVLRLCEDSTGLMVGPTDRRLPRAGLRLSQLRGEQYAAEGCRAGNFALGAPVTLVPEPENPHDDRAVAVYDATGRHKCGYVNKQKARAYLKRVVAGDQLAAISLRGTPAGEPTSSVEVLVATPAVLSHVRGPRPAGSPRPAYLG